MFRAKLNADVCTVVLYGLLMSLWPSNQNQKVRKFRIEQTPFEISNIEKISKNCQTGT